MSEPQTSYALNCSTCRAFIGRSFSDLSTHPMQCVPCADLAQADEGGPGATFEEELVRIIEQLKGGL